MTTAPAELAVGFDDIVAAARRLEGVAHRTPVLSSRTVDDRVGARVHFKCENFQRAGAFKFRGAYNALSRLREAEPGTGAIAFSSGNHAQAMALAGRLLGVPVTVVMPEDAPAVKLDATRGYGAEVVLYDRATTRREELGRQLAEKHGLRLVPPFDHPDIVAGQGTAARELLQEVGPLDLLLVCCGGGGLLSGSALAARAMAPGCRVVGVEPEAGDDATRSFHSGTLCRVENPATIADGARTESLGAITFPIVRSCVDDMVTVTDSELVATMRLLLERMKIVVEPTGALAAAALLSSRIDASGGRVGVIVSGGNVDPARLGEWLAG
jgi:threonine dehydratase